MVWIVPLLPYIAAAGAVVGAYAAVKQGQAASDAADYNAKMAAQNAEAMRQQGVQAQAAQKRDMGLKLGSLAANTGASGISSTTGSPLDVLSSSIQQGTLDNLNIKYNYQMKALGYQNSGTLDSAQSKSASTAGYLSAAGSLLGGAAQAGSMYAQQNGGGIPVAPSGNTGVRGPY
jgi:hypothetical protein